jgi:hypothetical protein
MLLLRKQSPMFADVQTIKPPEFVAAEIELGDIRLRQQELSEAIGKANLRLASEDSMVLHAAMQEVTRLERERGRWNHRSGELRRLIEQQKPAYARAVRAAIGHQRRAAAERIAKALQQYQSALVDLKAADRILNSVEANPQKFSEVPFLPRIVSTIERVIQECDKDLKG